MQQLQATRSETDDGQREREKEKGELKRHKSTASKMEATSVKFSKNF